MMHHTTPAICLLISCTLFAEAANNRFDTMLNRLDANQDQKISRDEFTGNPDFFRKLDQNRDGALTRNEVERMRQWSAPVLPDGVTVHRNLEYAVPDGESQKLDLYLPEAGEEAAPLLVWIHGGGWKKGDKGAVNRAVLRLTESGYAVASINYRLQDLACHPKNLHDCKGAVRWLRAKAATYGIDPERVAVGGGSAGGHLSLMLGVSHGIESLEGEVGGNTDQSSKVSAIVDFYGPSDLTVVNETSGRFRNAHQFEPWQLKDASPVTHLSKDDPPVLIIQGDEDRIVPPEQSELLHARYQEAGLESELHIIKGGGHGGPAFSDEERHQLIKGFLEQHL